MIDVTVRKGEATLVLEMPTPPRFGDKLKLGRVIPSRYGVRMIDDGEFDGVVDTVRWTSASTVTITVSSAGAGTVTTDSKACPYDEEEDFTLSELRLPSDAWRAVVSSREPCLREPVREWLAAWNGWDLAVSPIADDDRRFYRAGHYLGWFMKAGAIP